MNVTLTISVDHPEELPRVLKHLAASYGAVSAAPSEAPTAEGPKRGRPRKDSTPPEAPVAPAETALVTDAEPASEAPAETPAIAAAAPPAPSAAPQAAPEAAQPAPAGEAKLEKGAMQQLLIAVVQKHGRDAVGALCRVYGAGNLTAVDEKHWPALYADAKRALATEKGQFKVAA